MQRENIRRSMNNSEMKLEKFKKTAFEIIEYKDKIIKMLCAILEVQGVTNINIKEFITNSLNVSKEQLLDTGLFDSKKKALSSKKRKLIDINEYKSIKKNELNLFSSPNKNENLNNDKHLSDSYLSSHKISLHKRYLENNINNNLLSDFSKIKAHSKQLTQTTNGHILSVKKKIDSINKNYIESCKKAIESFKKNDINDYYKSDSIIERNISKNKKQNELSEEDYCQLCLMPNSESLHGSFPPLLYTLKCEHVFHLMCLYETIIRRECRKTCCVCHIEINENDKNEIINKVKIEKKENYKKTKMLLKAIQIQADKN